MEVKQFALKSIAMPAWIEKYFPPGIQIQRYIVKEYLFYFLVSFFFFLSIFFVNQILLLAREQLAEMISVIDTLRLVLFAMPSIIALSVPYASFIGIILAIGKLSEEREIMAARAGGVGYHVLFIPIVVAALTLSLSSFFVNDYLIPVSITNYSRLYQELLYSNSRLIIEPYSIRNFNGSILITGDVDDNSIYNLTILDTTNNGTKRTINASRAELVRKDQQQGVITLSLKEVEIISVTNDITQLSSAESMDYNILIENITINITNPSVREMSIRDVYKIMQEQSTTFDAQFEQTRREYNLQNLRYFLQFHDYANGSNRVSQGFLVQEFPNLQSDPAEYLFDRTLRLYRLELWKKFSIPLACLTFIFLGFPLGMMAMYAGRTLSIVLGFTISTVYWAILTINELVGINLVFVPEFFIAFFPNILMLISGVVLHYTYFRQ